MDEDSRDEGCFKNRKVFIEESSSAQTILKVKMGKYSRSGWVSLAGRGVEKVRLSGREALAVT